MIDPAAMDTIGRPINKSIEQPLLPNNRLIVFGRYPVPGRTKTRLIPALGPVGAADLQRRLTDRCLSTVLQSGFPASSVEFCHTDDTDTRTKQWLGHTGIAFTRQIGDHLGNRMHNALGAALKRGCRRAVLIGTDIPSMTGEHIRSAFAALEHSDLVLGPSRDGGYWLVGMNRPADIFQGVPWGGPGVLDRTLAEARRQGLAITQLEPLNDIDTETDLVQWRPDGHWRRPYLTVIVPVLDEARTIAKTIECLRSPDSEIIVADGGSRDKTVQLARAAGASIVNTARGRAIQQNSAARAASGRVLLFVHADTALPGNYASQVFETLMPAGVAAGAFRFKTDFDHWGMRLIEKTVRIRSTLFQMPYGDQALFVPRRTFEHIGGFPQVPIAEDLYLVKRLTRMGRIGQARATAITSARRWRTIGIWRVTLINYIIAGACLVGMNPKHLAPLYRLWTNHK